MTYKKRLTENSDSLIGLLAAQCVDLEALFDLAQKETEAAGLRDFEAILSIVTERTRIGQKLEVYQRQIAELRGFLAASEQAYESSPIAARMTAPAEQIFTQDSKTKLLLSEAREETSLELRNLATGKRSVSVYMQEAQKGLSFNESI